jgi:hypothetical protein
MVDSGISDGVDVMFHSFTSCHVDPLPSNALVSKIDLFYFFSSWMVFGQEIIRSKDRSVLVDAQAPHPFGVRHEARDRVTHPDIPQFDFTSGASGNEFAHPTSLHVHVDDPCLVVFPLHDHAVPRRMSTVIDSDSTIAKPSNKEVSCHLL